MGAKVTFDPATRSIIVTQAPVSGVVTLSIKVDVYSDGKEDWLTDANLQKMKFPIRPIGGDTIPGGVIGDTYVIEGGWTITPYEADHELILDGNVFAEAGELVDDTVGAYRVRVTSRVSTLVEVRQTAVSGLTPTESTALTNLDSNVTTIQSDVDLVKVDARVAARGKKVTKRSTDPATLPGTLEVYDPDDDSLVGTGDLWEDEDGTTGYQGRGIDRQDKVS